MGKCNFVKKMRAIYIYTQTIDTKFYLPIAPCLTGKMQRKHISYKYKSYLGMYRTIKFNAS